MVGALLCAFGLAGMTFGLIEQPLRGWGDPLIVATLGLGALLFASFLVSFSTNASARTTYSRGGLPALRSTWPHTQSTIRDQINGLPDDIIRKVTWENASRLYQHPVPAAVQADPNAF